MLEFPLHESFFPQVVLNADEVRYYKRLGKERLNELIRIAEDAELAYKWTDIRTPKMNTTIQKTQFLDMRPATKATFASTLIKCSVVVPDTRPEEALMAIARTRTKEYRKMMGHLHGSAFLDGRTLFKFPSSIAASRPDYSYRAIKWCAFKGRGDSSKLDFSFLEYAGKRKPAPGSMVVGFCLQESIQREREIPLLEDFGFVRGYLSRSGIIVSKTHQPNVVRITSICQIDGDIEPIVRGVLEGIMQEMVGSVVRMRGLLDRQRISGMKFLEQWEWVANSDRKACAVCLKGFFFHRKHHCRACGEVVCSSCAPLRQLDEPIYDIKELRICTSCMTKAGRMIAPEASQDRNNYETLTSDDSSQDFNGGEPRGPKKNASDERKYLENESKDRMRRPSDAARQILEKNNKGTPKTKRRLNTFMKNPRETVAIMSHLVDQIRDARETINVTISEAGESRMSFGEEDAYTELYDQMDKLRDTVEFSVDSGPQRPPSRRPSVLAAQPGDRRNSTLARQSTAPLLDDHDEDEDSLEYEFPAEDRVKEDFNSVLEKTFAAAKATRAVGRAVLSSCASDHAYSDPEVEIEDVLPSPSDSGYSSSDTSKDPYSSANYERLMGKHHGSNRDSLGTADDDHYSSAPPSFQSQKPLRSSRVQLLEKKIEDLQRDLMDAQRKLSFFEGDDSDPEYSGLGVVHEDPYVPEPNPAYRVKPRPMRRPSDFSRSNPESRGRPTAPKPRKASDGRANLPARRSMDGSLDRQHGEYKRRGSEFTPRPSVPAMTSRASVGGRAHSTAEMLTELYSVMNPTEISKPVVPPRKASSIRNSPSPQMQRGTRTPSPSNAQKPRRAPPPPPPVSRETVFVDDKGRLLPGTPSPSFESPKNGNGLDKTASSSASYLEHSRSSNGSGLGNSGGPRRNDSFGSSHYRDRLGDNPAHDDDETSSDDHEFYENASNQHEEDEPQPLPAQRKSTFFGDLGPTDRAFFGQQVFPAARPPQPPSRRGSVLAGAPRASVMARGGRDESEELRDLMEGLVRPRSSSVPFGAPGASPRDEAYDRPTWSDGATARRQSSPFAREPIATRYDRPSYGDERYARRPLGSSGSRSRGESGSQSRYDQPPPQRGPRQLDSAVAQVRACLSSLHTECPSQWERHRKLQSISKILKSLQRDGPRSKFRSLSHEEFQYERVLDETPSIVQLLRLAGYVSQPDKLVMRNVDPEYITVLLHEIEDELNEMQATQDYL